MQIRGNTQIIAGTIYDAQIAASAAIATSKLADGANFIKRDGTVAFTADQSMGGFKLTNLAAPVANTDAATKTYVDNLASSGLTLKLPCVATTTANVTLSGLTTQAGGDWSATLTAGDRVLVKNQTDATANGIYVVGSGAWTRATDFNSASNILTNSFCFVGGGSTLADTGWVLTTDGTITVGTTSLTFVQFSAAGVIIAGAALAKTGNTLDVQVSATGGIQITSNALNIKLADALLTTSASGLTLANLTSGYVYVGNSSNRPTGVALSGDATISNTGVVTVASSIQRTAGFVYEETPTGSINGSNTAFTIANTPVAGSVRVYVNGLREKATTNFTVSGSTITMVTAPSTGDVLVVEYMK
jgi:hypothetical protein